MSPSKDSPVSGHEVPAPPKPATVKGFSLASKASSAKPLSFSTKRKDLSTGHGQSSSSTLGRSSPLALGKRPRSALHDDSDSDDGHRHARHEEVTGFDIREGGAVVRKNNEDRTREKKGPLVIPRIANRDWRGEIRRRRGGGKDLLPPEERARREGRGKADGGAIGKENMPEEEPQWGLTITKKAVNVEVMSGEESSNVIGTALLETEAGEAEKANPTEKTLDELALEALTGAGTEKKGPDLVILAAAAADDGESRAPPITEKDAYRRAVQAAPDVSTLEDYERVPVEDFGLALLRGMGFKEGDGKNGRVARPKEVKKRQNLLGLGATELKNPEELGAWTQHTDPKRALGRSGGERRPKANEYREREDRKRESRDEKYGEGYRRDRDGGRERERDRDRDRERDRDRDRRR